MASSHPAHDYQVLLTRVIDGRGIVYVCVFAGLFQQQKKKRTVTSSTLSEVWYHPIVPRPNSKPVSKRW